MASHKISNVTLSLVAFLLLAFLAGAAHPVRGEADSHMIRLDGVAVSAAIQRIETLDGHDC